MTSIDGGLWPLLKVWLSQWDWQRIETGGTGRGIPDCNGCCAGNDIWVELKGTSGWSPVIRPEQVAWAERRARNGGRVFLAVRRICEAGPRRESADELWLYRSEGFRSVSIMGLKPNPPALLLTGGSRNWDWAQVHELFMS